MKKVVAALLVLGALGMMPAMSHAANANQCKDAKGKFIKCPAPAKPTPVTANAKATPAVATASTKCRDAKGKFIACPTAAATPPKPKTCRDAKGKFIKCAA